MTDARFPERWLNDARLQRVSPAAYRLFANALMWSVSNRTDGHVPTWALGLIPWSEPGDAKELVQVSLWLDHISDGWIIGDYEDTQTTRDDLEILTRGRRTQAASKRRRRHHAQGDHSLCDMDNCPCPPDIYPDVPQDSPRPGQARTGQDRQTHVQEKNLRGVDPPKGSPVLQSGGLAHPPDCPPDIQCPPDMTQDMAGHGTGMVS
jgi:hypothetical protein